MSILSSASSWSPTSEAGASAPPVRLARGAGFAHLLRLVAGQALFQVLVAGLGFLVFAASFRLGLARGIDILFYRGLVLLAVAGVVTLALAAFAAGRMQRLGLGPSAVIGAASLSLALNLSVFVLGPVTVDRSVSVFLLASMSREPDRPVTTDEMSERFRDVYVGELRQIERRFGEQTVSGNLERAGAGYRLTPQGLAFVALSRRMAWLFEADPRLVQGGR